VVVTLAVLTGLVAVANWYAVGSRRARVERWTKPLTMAALIATALAADAGGSAAGRWLLVALVFGLLGDVALLGDTTRRFLAGVAAFLIGHLGYVACFVALGLPSPGWAWAVVAILLAVLVVTRDVVPAAYRLAGAAVAAPVAVYSLVIAAMLVLAWLTGHGPIAAGASVFVVSDSIIGLSLGRFGFRGPSGRTHVAIMVTYHLGQALIAIGVLAAAG
jgi:uncharacterized membrane protein YhhN